MLGDTPVCFGHGIRSTIERHGLEFLFERSKEYLSNSDVLFGNLETVLSDDRGCSNLYGMEMKGRSEYAAGLVNIGFNVMSVANNHAMQHGKYAYNNSVAELQKRGINPVGINDGGRSNCIYIEQNTIKLAFIGYSFRPEKYARDQVSYAQIEESQLLAHIKELKECSTHVVVSVHWGEEYMHYPSINQVHFAKHIIDSGASLVLGHHPHVLQGIEEYNHGIIVYSLGNFIFDNWQRRTRETIIFHCTFGDKGIEVYGYKPVYINKFFQPIVLSGKKEKKIRFRMQKYSDTIVQMNSMIDTNEEKTIYKQRASKAYTKHRMKCYLYFILNIYKYSPSVILDSFIRFVKRRLDPSHV